MDYGTTAGGLSGKPRFPRTAAHDKVVWIASPAVLNRLGENRNWQSIGHKTLHWHVSAGGALPSATADLLQQAAVRPFEVYGSTETGVIASRCERQEWQPFEGVEIGQNERRRTLGLLRLGRPNAAKPPI